MGKKVAFLLEAEFESLDFFHVSQELINSGVIITVFGPTLSLLRSKGGKTATIDKTFEALDAKEYDAAVICGGNAPFQLRKQASILNFIKNMHEQQKLIGAIGTAPIVLAAAGLLLNVKITGSPQIESDLELSHAILESKGVVSDQNILTCKDQSSLAAFTKIFLSHLK